MTDELRQEVISVLKKDITYLKRLLTASLSKEMQDAITEAKRLPGKVEKRDGSVQGIALEALNTVRSTLFSVETPNLII